jgi:hypothetical protein
MTKGRGALPLAAVAEAEGVFIPFGGPKMGSMKKKMIEWRDVVERKEIADGNDS